MSYSLNSLNWGYIGDFMGVIKGHIGMLGVQVPTNWVRGIRVVVILVQVVWSLGPRTLNPKR